MCPLYLICSCLILESNNSILILYFDCLKKAVLSISWFWIEVSHMLIRALPLIFFVVKTPFFQS